MKHSFILESLASSRVTPAHLALVLHMAGNTELSIPFPDNWDGSLSNVGDGYEVVSGVLKFESLKHRNQLLAEFLYAEYFSGKIENFKELFSVANDLYNREFGREDFVAGRLLLKVSEIADVFLLAGKFLGEGPNTFRVLHVLETYLHHADSLNIESLFFLAREQHEKTKNDLMSGTLYNAIEKWITLRPKIAHEMYQRAIEETDDITASFISVSLYAISKSDINKAASLCVSLINAAKPRLQGVGRWMAGQLLQRTELAIEQRNEIEGYILAALKEGPGILRTQAIRATTNVLHVCTTFDDALIALAKNEDQEVLALIGNALFQRSNELQSQNRFFIWLPLLVALKPSGEDSLGGIDYVLAQHIADDSAHSIDVIKFLTAWTLRNSGSSPLESAFSENFNECMVKISGKPAILAKLVVDWFSHDDRQLAGAAASMLSELEVYGYETIQLDADRLAEMNENDLRFLVARILGFVHSTKYLISIAFSFLQVEDSALVKTIPILRWLLVEEIGYDYPGTTVDALKQAEQAETRPSIQLVLKEWRVEIELLQQELDALPRLNELRPPAQLQRKFQAARNKQMNQAREKASEKSIMRQIATQIPVKAGRGFFNHSHGQYSEPSTMHTVSYSIELPRRNTLDSVGNDHRGFYYRTLKKTFI
ncbi:MAG: hypothetical protein Q7T66_10435 [Herminiimonas sp.]|uniref:hypothetical protein n=1 Tax=Herminiimonas sp. TaxID=1926289 RepID=UPI0027293A89|nr:hypothetical protein [Herminiimonas sp.]MDO9421070.1 hypothetical protein [Herminiimonas sp.]